MEHLFFLELIPAVHYIPDQKSGDAVPIRAKISINRKLLFYILNYVFLQTLLTLDFQKSKNLKIKL